MGLIPGSGRSPGEGNATHSSILARKSPWTEEPGRLQSKGSQRVRQGWVTEHTHKDIRGTMHVIWIRVKVKSESESHSVLSDYLQPHGLYSPWNSPGQYSGVLAVPLSRGSSNPGIEPRCMMLQNALISFFDMDQYYPAIKKRMK